MPSRMVPQAAAVTQQHAWPACRAAAFSRCHALSLVPTHLLDVLPSAASFVARAVKEQSSSAQERGGGRCTSWAVRQAGPATLACQHDARQVLAGQAYNRLWVHAQQPAPAFWIETQHA